MPGNSSHKEQREYWKRHLPQKYDLQRNFFAIKQDRLSLGQVDLQRKQASTLAADALAGRNLPDIPDMLYNHAHKSAMVC